MAGFPAGLALRGDFIRVLGARASSNLQPTATLADIPGATVTFSVTGANAFLSVAAVAGIKIATTESAHNMVADLVVDGVSQTGEIIWPTGLAATFVTLGQTWGPIAAAAGSHTVKLQGRNDGTSSADRVFLSTFTALNLTIYDVP